MHFMHIAFDIYQFKESYRELYPSDVFISMKVIELWKDGGI
jgi:hypothetical protein